VTVLERVTVDLKPKRKGRPAREEPGALVRMSEELIMRARTLGVGRGMSAGQIIEELVGGPLDAAWDTYVRGLSAGRGRSALPVAEPVRGPVAPETTRPIVPAMRRPGDRVAEGTVGPEPSRHEDRIALGQKVWELHVAKMTQRGIAETLGISLGLVNKIIQEFRAAGMEGKGSE
jgi:hypothetical protein